MLQKIIYKLGVKWRNPSLLRQFESLKKSDKWSIEKLQAYQFELSLIHISEPTRH